MKFIVNIICTITGIIMVNIACTIAQLPSGSAFWFSAAIIVISGGWAFPSTKK